MVNQKPCRGVIFAIRLSFYQNLKFEALETCQIMSLIVEPRWRKYNHLHPNPPTKTLHPLQKKLQ